MTIGDVLFRIVGWAAGLNLALLIVFLLKTSGTWRALLPTTRFVLSCIAAAIGTLIGYSIGVSLGVLVADLALIVCYLLASETLVQLWRIRYDP